MALTDPAVGEELLLRMQVGREPDVFLARQRARDIAGVLGFETVDQVRIATAVSEVGRIVVGARERAVVELGLLHRTARLVVRVTASASLAGALDAGRRLMDSLTVTSSPFRVEMSKALPPAWLRLVDTEAAAVRLELARRQEVSPLEELRQQNLQLLDTLEQLSALNEELRETNDGVMAMFTQLSGELDETNRGVVALYADLEERGVQLRDANTAKSRFLASVSHELRTPLNSVIALSRLLREPDSDPLTPAQASQLALLESSAKEQLTLVNGLLDLARAESGRLVVNVEEVDVTVLLTELRATLRPLARPGVELVFAVDPAAAVLATDRALLGQLLRNLIGNALKFTEAGEVRVDVGPGPDGRVELVVTDTGIGIAPEHQQLVFEEFFQVPGRLQLRTKSTGLGLAHARQVALALGGSLTLTSRPGVGSTFTVSLPAPAGPGGGVTA